jgi:antirestriction protein ArdC
MTSKFDLYQTVTDRVIALMTTHGANWVNPFNKKAGAYTPRNPITGKAYQGINTFLLATTPYVAPYWAGYGQWADRKCQVRKGEKSTMIVYWKILESKKTVEGVETTSKRPLLRYLSVFNVDQVEGDFADTLKAVPIAAPVAEVDTIALADAFIAATGADIRSTDKPSAFYSPGLDIVHMPNRSLFTATATSSATECYYSTLAHELTHWTGHTSRLSRDFTGRFGSDAYAFEELVAELGAAMLCAQLGISIEPRPDHAQYLNNWLKVLKSDNAAILKAATLAKQAAAFLSAAAESEEETAEAA